MYSTKLDALSSSIHFYPPASTLFPSRAYILPLPRIHFCPPAHTFLPSGAYILRVQCQCPVPSRVLSTDRTLHWGLDTVGHYCRTAEGRPLCFGRLRRPGSLRSQERPLAAGKEEGCRQRKSVGRKGGPAGGALPSLPSLASLLSGKQRRLQGRIGRASDRDLLQQHILHQLRR